MSKLDSWMLYFNSNDSDYKEIDPILNKDGIYLHHGACWFEVNGRAWTYDSRQFLYDLSIEGIKIYPESVYKALYLLKREKMLSKSQAELLHNFECWKGHRDVYRNMRVLLLKNRNRFKNFSH